MSNNTTTTPAALAARGLTARQIADALPALSEATIRRALAKAAPAPAATLRPAHPAPKKLGRPSLYAPLAPEAAREAAALALDTTPLRMARAGSARVALALRALAAHKPHLLPEGLAVRVLSGRPAPDAILRQVGEAVKADSALLLRDRRGRLGITYTPLANRWVDRDGVEREKRFGDWFVADDMTLNFPFWVEAPSAPRWLAEAGEDSALTTRAGRRVARAQMLAFMDAGTLFFLGNALWSQNTDAYGCYAILWTAGQVLAAHGKPRGGFRFEHGAWKSADVTGTLARIGCPVINAQSANGKIIEGRFNVFQDIMAARMRLLGLAHLHLGRTRGEHTEGKKLWLAMRAGKLEPEACGVPHISKMQEIIAGCMDEHNWTVSRGKTCRGRSPEALRGEHLSADAPLARLGEAERWRVMPGVAHVRLRDGMARARSKVFGPDGAFYSQPALFSALSKGYPVELRYDIASPETAAVFSDDGGSSVSRSHLAAADPAYGTIARGEGRDMAAGVVRGEFLGYAELVAKMPGEVLARWGDYMAGHEARKEYRRHATAHFQAIFGRGQRGALRQERHDGRGGSQCGVQIEAAAPEGLAARAQSPQRPARTDGGRGLKDSIFGGADDIFAEAMASAGAEETDTTTPGRAGSAMPRAQGIISASREAQEAEKV